MIVCWPVCIGIRQRTETRVGLLSLGVIILGTFSVILMENLSNHSHLLLKWILLFCPLSLLGAVDAEYGGHGFIYSLFANLLMLALLFTFAIWQLSRPEKARGN
jgi:hypothetical protein